MKLKNKLAHSASLLFLVIASTISGNAQSFLTNGLIAFYPLNGSANDATGNGNNGQIVGNVTPATDRFGVPGNAYHFDGTNSSIAVTNDVFNIGSNYTISAWFSSDDVTKFQQCVFNTLPETGIVLELNNANVPKYLMYGIGPASAFWTVIYGHGVDTNYTDQTWYQLAFTKSGTSYTVYINGQTVMLCNAETLIIPWTLRETKCCVYEIKSHVAT